MLCYVSFDGDGIGQKVGRARLADDVTEIRRTDQAINHGNEIWRSYALRVGGNVVEIAGDEGTIEVPADKLEELPKLREQYAEAVGASVSVGVGMKISESAKALLAAKLTGKNKVMFYSPEVDKIIKEAEAKLPDEASKIIEEYLSPMTKAVAMNPGAFAGHQQPNSAAKPTQPTAEASEHSQGEGMYNMLQDADENQPPAPEMTHAGKDFEEHFHEAAQQQEAKDKQDSQHSETDELKQQVAAVLQKVKQQAPMLEQLRQSAPDAYQAIMAMTQAMIALARELVGPTEMQKSEEPLEKMALVHNDPSKPMTVYRVQNERGEGPYGIPNEKVQDAAHAANSILASDSAEMHGLKMRGIDRQPGPVMGGDFTSKEMGMLSPMSPNKAFAPIFGFESPVHAREWFGNEGLARMKEQGFHLTPMKAKRIWRSKSGRQVFFEPHVEEPVKKDELELTKEGAHPTVAEHHHLNLPVGSQVGDKIKVQHNDGAASWKEMSSGQILSQDPSGHPTSSRTPGSR